MIVNNIYSSPQKQATLKLNKHSAPNAITSHTHFLWLNIVGISMMHLRGGLDSSYRKW